MGFGVKVWGQRFRHRVCPT